MNSISPLLVVVLEDVPVLLVVLEQRDVKVFVLGLHYCRIIYEQFKEVGVEPVVPNGNEGEVPELLDGVAADESLY